MSLMVLCASDCARIPSGDAECRPAGTTRAHMAMGTASVRNLFMIVSYRDLRSSAEVRRRASIPGNRAAAREAASSHMLFPKKLESFGVKLIVMPEVDMPGSGGMGRPPRALMSPDAPPPARKPAAAP